MIYRDVIFTASVDYRSIPKWMDAAKPIRRRINGYYSDQNIRSTSVDYGEPVMAPVNRSDVENLWRGN